MFRMEDKGAQAKIRMLNSIPQAVKHQMTKWSGSAIKNIIRNISGHILKTRTGHLRRNIGFKLSGFRNYQNLAIGTGVGGRKSVKYASILERGGIIRPKRASWLTIPLPGIKGMARNYPDSFFIKSKKGNLLLVQKAGRSGIKPLFVLRKQVRIPAFKWLSTSIKERMAELRRMMAKKELLNVAKRLGG